LRSRIAVSGLADLSKRSLIVDAVAIELRQLLIAMMMTGPVADWIAEVMRAWMPFPSIVST